MYVRHCKRVKNERPISYSYSTRHRYPHTNALRFEYTTTMMRLMVSYQKDDLSENEPLSALNRERGRTRIFRSSSPIEATNEYIDRRVYETHIRLTLYRIHRFSCSRTRSIMLLMSCMKRICMNAHAHPWWWEQITHNGEWRVEKNEIPGSIFIHFFHCYCSCCCVLSVVFFSVSRANTSQHCIVSNRLRSACVWDREHRAWRIVAESDISFRFACSVSISVCFSQLIESQV